MMPAYYHHDVRTTLTLDDDVAAKLAQEVRRSGRPFRSVVNETLRLGLLRRSPEAARTPFRVRTHDLGMRAGIDVTNVEELFDRLDGPGRQ